MAKKKSAGSADTKASSERTKQVKFWVSPAEHHRLKVAAAILDRPMAELCREVVLGRAEELTAELNLPAEREQST